MITQEQLKEELRRIIKEENITTPEQLCESSTISSLITNYVYDQILETVCKADDIVHDKIMKEHFDELVNYFEDDEDDEYGYGCCGIYNEIYDCLVDDVVVDAASELHNEVINFLSDTEKIIYQVISENSSTKEDADKFKMYVRKLIDNGVKYYESCENVDTCKYKHGVVDYSYYFDIARSSLDGMYDPLYQDILEEREYIETKNKFIHDVNNMNIDSE